LTAPGNTRRPPADTPATWLPVASTERLVASDLVSWSREGATILGIVAGSSRVLAREVRSDGRLGPSVSIAVAEAGEMLVVPAGGDRLRFFVSGSEDLEAVILDPARAGDLVAVNPENLFAEQLGDTHAKCAWLQQLQEDAPALTWSKLLSALPAEARRLAERAIEADRDKFHQRLEQSRAFDDKMLDEAVQYAARGARIASEHVYVTGVNPLDAACRHVAEAAGAVVPERIHYHENTASTLLEQFTRAAHLNRRTVLLQGHWWTEEAGPLLAFRRDDHAPVALVPTKSGYEARMSRPGTSASVEIVPVDGAFAATLNERAEMFYAGLPARALALRDIVDFVTRGNGPDALTIALTTLATSLLVALVPVITGTVIDWIIPQVAVNALVFVGLLLLFAAGGRMLLHVVAGFAFLRIETRSSFGLMAAFVDRLLQLPASFYRGRSSGDLTQRVMAIEKVRSMLTQTTLSVVMSFFAGVANLVVLFAYDAHLATWGVGLAMLEVVIIGFISVYLARRNFELSIAQGELDGLAFDLIKGIQQARIQGSLPRVLARVLQRLVPVGQASYRMGIATAANRAVLVGFEGVTLAVVFTLYASRIDTSGGSTMTDGGFVASITALTAFFGATAMLGPAISAVAEAIPQYYRLKPMMEAVPEVSEIGRKTHQVTGDISVRNVVFRYGEGLPAVLDGVSIDARPGEFIAIVGRTGCGKSTLMNVILGLEEPESGSVLYDGIPMRNLDPSIVRSQLGVVMQSNTMLPGTLKSTILGVGTDRTLDDAWDAARLVRLEDEIDSMPMGMLTMVGSSTLSNSQTQKLLIARALVNRPKILLLDEATSALDNHAQEEVAESIAEIANTRIAIAHRLSTIRKADRIYVLKEGKLAQTGTFEELSSTEGHFRDLMAGQMA